jgi:hypothetical protein
MRFRSRIAWRKAAPILRTPAGDPADDDESCECGASYLLSEDGQPIEQEQNTVWLSPE